MEEEIEEVERMTPAEVGTILHMTAENVRAGLRQNKLPFRHSISREYRSMDLFNNKKQVLCFSKK